MSKTFLNGVNDVLDRAGIIGANGTLTSFTDTGKQTFIDLAKMIWNETIDEVGEIMDMAPSGEAASSTITLVTSTREYSLPSNLIQIRWPLIYQTLGYTIEEYVGGYEKMRLDQLIPAQFTGLPYYAAINPTTGYLRMERAPTSDVNGYGYDLFYDKDISMSAITDVFPFDDAVYRALVPVVCEGFERKKRNDFDAGVYRQCLSRAVSFANKAQRRLNW